MLVFTCFYSLSPWKYSTKPHPEEHQVLQTGLGLVLYFHCERLSKHVKTSILFEASVQSVYEILLLHQVFDLDDSFLSEGLLSNLLKLQIYLIFRLVPTKIDSKSTKFYKKSPIPKRNTKQWTITMEHSSYSLKLEELLSKSSRK